MWKFGTPGNKLLSVHLQRRNTILGSIVSHPLWVWQPKAFRDIWRIFPRAGKIHGQLLPGVSWVVGAGGEGVQP